MAREVRRFTASIPAGTPPSAPVVVDVSFPPRQVLSIDWRVPPGPAGLMGWRLSMGGVQLIPTFSDPWLIEDNARGTFTLEGYPDSGAWQVTGYNTGTNPHSVFLVFHLALLVPGPVPRPRLDPRALMPVPDASRFARPPGGAW